MRVFLPYHLGSGNRGCEGIARGVANIFQLSPEELIMYNISSYDDESDHRLGLDQIGQLRFKGTTIDEASRFVARVFKRLGNHKPYRRFLCNYYLHDLTADDVVFVTGGDIYCYEGQYILPNMIAKKAKEIGAKTVLYGVSMEEKLLTSEVVNGLRYYDQIITRESISAETLNKIGLQNSLYPDPAFSLSPRECKLPDYFKEKDVVGINFSTFTDKSGQFKKNMVNLINYIVSKGMCICLIPHVFWKGQDDRINIKEIADLYENNVYTLDAEKMSYLEIRYLISKCKYFIGGRTHSVISAYSTHTPCIALGYSVKSIGLAKDIGLPEYTLVDSKKLTASDQLLNAFKQLEDHTQDIKNIYESMDQYAKKSYGAREAIKF